MKYRTLGTTGVEVSCLGLGAMTFGEPTPGSMMHGLGCDVPTSHAILDRALERGVNFVDVADVYGNDGLSERVVGEWLEKDRNRDRVVLATKFRFRMEAGPNGVGASRYRIMRTVEASLRRLRTDRIDLYQVHMQDLSTPEEETLRALDDLVRAGKVLYIGCSNYMGYRLMDALWISKTQGLERFATMQMHYNLLERSIEREHLPIAREKGVGIIPWSPLAGGFLTGKASRGSAPSTQDRLGKFADRFERLDTDKNWKVLEAVREIARRRGTTPSAVSLAWLLSRREVSSVIFGARNLEQLDTNLGAADLELDAAEAKALDEVSAPGLGYPEHMIRNTHGRW
ncbi:MAG: aldo/keto reductase [Deltaproteobacteria bacterium]|nr:aldo/keto reductase [Deltaproteobacteria bacterium]